MHTQLQQFRRFAQYNAWFNGRVYDLVATLPSEQRARDLGAFFGSIHGTLSHILIADRLWLARFRRSPLGFASLEGAALLDSVGSLSDDLWPSFEDLRAERAATDGVLSAFVAELTPELLAADLDYRNTKGVAFTAPVWHVVAHVFNHQTHHRGQVTTLLMQLGHDPGMTDFMLTAYMPEPDSAR